MSFLPLWESSYFKDFKGTFLLPSMAKDVNRVVESYSVCKRAKSWSESQVLYMPFPIPIRPCVDLSMNFVLGLLRT